MVCTRLYTFCVHTGCTLTLVVPAVVVAGVEEPDDDELEVVAEVVVVLLLLFGELRREAVLRLARIAVRPTCTLP